MDYRDAQQMETRLKTYRALEARAKQIRTAMDQLTTDRPEDPNKTGPFTSNMRESRKIEGIDIQFTQTRGGSPPVSMALFNLGIEAYEFRQHLMTLLSAKLDLVQAEMGKL